MSPSKTKFPISIKWFTTVLGVAALYGSIRELLNFIPSDWIVKSEYINLFIGVLVGAGSSFLSDFLFRRKKEKEEAND